MNDFGPQYARDDEFKAAARQHQSLYRQNVLRVGYSEYGNRLCDSAAGEYLNYYSELGVRAAVHKIGYVKKRDADMLRSEHIPFNLLFPLGSRPALLRSVLQQSLGIVLNAPYDLKIEWAPTPAANYLGDLTSFDTYIAGTGADGERVGIGIEVKYTEQSYRIGKSEAARVRCKDSSYWRTTHASGCFLNGGSDLLGSDKLRQIWRNHLLGLSMVLNKDLDQFYSVTLHPQGNAYIGDAVASYSELLEPHARTQVRAWTFESYIAALRGDPEIGAWKQYLQDRYLVAT
jgi:hypothetical protein